MASKGERSSTRRSTHRRPVLAARQPITLRIQCRRRSRHPFRTRLTAWSIRRSSNRAPTASRRQCKRARRPSLLRVPNFCQFQSARLLISKTRNQIPRNEPFAYLPSCFQIPDFARFVYGPSTVILFIVIFVCAARCRLARGSCKSSPLVHIARRAILYCNLSSLFIRKHVFSSRVCTVSPVISCTILGMLD